MTDPLDPIKTMNFPDGWRLIVDQNHVSVLHDYRIPFISMFELDERVSYDPEEDLYFLRLRAPEEGECICSASGEIKTAPGADSAVALLRDYMNRYGAVYEIHRRIGNLRGVSGRTLCQLSQEMDDLATLRSASEKDLTTIDGIGPKRAAAIKQSLTDGGAEGAEA
jgi:hypothetical protein